MIAVAQTLGECRQRKRLLGQSVLLTAEPALGCASGGFALSIWLAPQPFHCFAREASES